MAQPNETATTETSPETTSAEQATTSTTSEPAATSEAKAEAPPVAAASASADAEDDSDEEGDEEGSDGPDGPEGPEGPGDPNKKKKRRRRKKKASSGPEGPPVEVAAAHRENNHQQRRDKRPAPPRERGAFQFGEEVFGKVTAVLDDAIMVDMTGKALAIFDRSEFDGDGALPSVGDKFVAQVLSDGTRGGLVILTRKMLREEEAKPKLEKAHAEKTTVEALVTGVIKGGIEVLFEGVRGFAPASHVDMRPGADLSHLVGKRLPFYVETYAKKGRDVVFSRKALIEEEFKKARQASLSKLAEGAVVKAVVRTVVANLGAFVAIPEADGIEGLVHISEVSHDQRAKLNDLVKVGDEISVKVLKIEESGKLKLSKKATEADPWEELKARYAAGTRHTGKVTTIQPFGVFVELEPGRDGVIFMADLSIKRIERAQDVVKEGDAIEVVIHSVDWKTKKITLHPAPPANEANVKQRVQLHKSVKAIVVSHEASGMLVRLVGMSGRASRAFVPAGQTGTPRGTDLRKLFPVNSEIEAKVIELDPKRGGEARLSIKALKDDSEKAAYNEYRASVAKEAKFGTFGDLLKKAQQQNS